MDNKMTEQDYAKKAVELAIAYLDSTEPFEIEVRDVCRNRDGTLCVIIEGLFEFNFSNDDMERA